jgi:hypothetical protein
MNGEMFPQQKFHLIGVFVGSEKTHVEKLAPHILIATLGCANAGIDCDLVNKVICEGFPPSIIDLFQALGRTGRRQGSGPATDSFLVIASLQLYKDLLVRMYLQKNEEASEDDGAQLALVREELCLRRHHDLDEVLRLLVLPQDCMHRQIGYLLGNPYNRNVDKTNDSPCINACPICLSQFDDIFLPVVRHTITSWVVQHFYAKGRTKLLPDFVTAMKTAPNAGHLFYGFKDGNKTPPPTHVIHGTNLQFIALDFLEISVECNDDVIQVLVNLKLDVKALTSVIVNDETAWGMLHTIDKPTNSKVI